VGFDCSLSGNGLAWRQTNGFPGSPKEGTNLPLEATGPFTYGGEGTPDNPCTPAVATTRLFFQTSNAGGFDFTHFWWSNPASVVVANGTLQVTANVDPAQWSDWNGQFGTTVPDGFNAAAANVTDIGLSFGGGCFFENGVGAPGGASFTLNGFTVN
jgi:hypothetical protein